MKPMSVMVIGGAGYIGTELVKTLANHAGFRVTVVDLCWFGNWLPGTVELWAIDAWTLNPDHLRNYDVVIFLAGLSNDPMAEFSPSQNFIANAALPAYLGFISKEAGVGKFVFASSCSVYGQSGDRIMTEDDYAQPAFPYALAKIQAEAVLTRLADDRFTVQCLRKGTVCGYSERLRLDVVLNTMMRDALTKGRIVVRGPSVWRPIISMRDTVHVYKRFIEQEARSGIYNVACGNYTLEQLGRCVYDFFQEVGRSIDLVIEEAQNPRNYRVDLSKLTTEIGFVPRQLPDSIVRELYQHMVALDPASLYAPHFYNVEIFKRVLALDGDGAYEAISQGARK